MKVRGPSKVNLTLWGTRLAMAFPVGGMRTKGALMEMAMLFPLNT